MVKKETVKLESRFDQALAIKTEKFNSQSHETSRYEDKSNVLLIKKEDSLPKEGGLRHGNQVIKSRNHPSSNLVHSYMSQLVSHRLGSDLNTKDSSSLITHRTLAFLTPMKPEDEKRSRSVLRGESKLDLIKRGAEQNRDQSYTTLEKPRALSPIQKVSIGQEKVKEIQSSQFQTFSQQKNLLNPLNQAHQQVIKGIQLAEVSVDRPIPLKHIAKIHQKVLLSKVKREKEDPWKDQRHPTFPIPKQGVKNKIVITDGMQLRKDIDSVITSKFPQHYPFNQSSKQYLERVVNFEGKLQSIDTVLSNGCFSGAYNLMNPKHSYLPNPVTQRKGIKIGGVNDAKERDDLRVIKYQFDHQGKLLTMNGSRYENFDHMNDVRNKRQQELQERRALKVKQNQPEVPEESLELEILNHEDSSITNKLKKDQVQTISPYLNSMQFQTSLRKEDSIDSKILNKTHKSNLSGTDKDLGSKVKLKKTRKNPLLNLLIQHLTTRLAKEIAKETCLRLARSFRKELLKKLDAQDDVLEEIKAIANDDSGDDQDIDGLQKLISRIPDEEFEKRLYSSQYNDEFTKMMEGAREKEVEQKMVDELAGKKGASIQKEARSDSLFAFKLKSVQDKLQFVYHISKAYGALDKVLRPKAIKRWNLSQFDQSRVEKIVKSVQEDLTELHNRVYRAHCLDDEPGLFQKSLTLDEIIGMFSLECAAEKVVPPRLSTKVIQETKRLVVQGQKLNLGLCKALARIMDKLVPQYINTLILEDNQFEEEGLCFLLRGIQSAKGFKGLYFIRNHLGDKACRELQKIIEIPFPDNLDTLVLTGSTLSQPSLSCIFSSLLVDNSLINLGLSQLNLQPTALAKLLTFLSTTPTLTTLDLSFLHLPSTHSLTSLLTTLCSNSQAPLHSLNVSHNPQIDQKGFVDSMIQLMRKAGSLTHVNMTCCGLGEEVEVLRLVGDGVKGSKTIQSVHFSGNQLKKSTVEKIREILGVRKVEREVQAGSLSSCNDDQYDSKTPLRSQVTHRAIKKAKTVGQPQADPRFHRGVMLDQHLEEETILENDKYVWTRILGKLEIQDGYRWVERNVCWICERWQYVLLIWSQVVGDNLYDLMPAREFLQQHTELPKSDQDWNLQPYIFAPSQAPQPMLQMGDFVERLELNFKPHQRIIIQKEEAKRLKEKQEEKLARTVQKSEFARKLTKMQAGMGQQDVEYIKRQRKLQNQEEWKTIFKENKIWPLALEKLLISRQPQIAQSVMVPQVTEIKPKPDEIFYAFADYFPPTIHQPAQFAVYSQTFNKNAYLKNIHIPPRQELKQKVGVSYKRTKKCRIDRNFNLKNSVFGIWSIKLQDIFRKCFEADMQYSKLRKFLKDDRQYQEVCDTLLKNYGQIFEVYIYSCGRSNYPSIQWMDFTDSCSQEWKVLDKNLTLATVDRLFIAVNFEGVPGGLEDNPDKELCRYEFYEILVRMAVAKHPNIEPAEALMKMLDECIYCDPNILSWWQFKQDLIWTLEVDDLFKTNALAIKKLYQSVMSPTKKTFSLEDSIRMISNCPGLHLSDKDASLAFAYSKFPVIDEMQDILSVQQFSLSEFYEFIARIAQIRYSDPQIPLFEKCYRVMLELFKLVGMRPQYPKTQDIGDSESDYDDF